MTGWSLKKNRNEFPAFAGMTSFFISHLKNTDLNIFYKYDVDFDIFLDIQ